MRWRLCRRGLDARPRMAQCDFISPLAVNLSYQAPAVNRYLKLQRAGIVAGSRPAVPFVFAGGHSCYSCDAAGSERRRHFAPAPALAEHDALRFK